MKMIYHPSNVLDEGGVYYPEDRQSYLDSSLLARSSLLCSKHLLLILTMVSIKV